MEEIPLLQVKKRLRVLGMKELQIAKFIELYTLALKQNVPYPFYYAFTKLTI